MALIDLINLYLGITDNDDKGDSAKSGGQKINDNFEKIKTKIASLDNIDANFATRIESLELSEGNNKGQFSTILQLQTAHPTPTQGWYAYVFETTSQWRVNTSNQWYDTEQDIKDNYLNKNNNLSDLTDKEVARNNLEVYNKLFIDQLDNGLQLQINALTTNLETEAKARTDADASLQETKVNKATLTEEVQDIMSTTLVDTNEIGFTYNDFDNNISANIKNTSIFNDKIANNANIETSKIKQTIITPVLNIFTNGDTQDVINNKAQGQINNLQDQINARPVGASSGNKYWLTSQPSDIPNYELIDINPDPSPLDAESITINSSTAKENRLIHSYISSNEIGSTIINGGTWNFDFYGYVSHLNNSNLKIEVFKRSGTIETLLFDATTPPFLETTQQAVPDKNRVRVEKTEQSFSCNTTDKIVIKIYGQTDRAQDTTITLLHSGTDYASHIHTPLITSHDQTPGAKGGDTTNGRWHLSLAEYNNVQNLTANLALKQNNIIKVNTQAEMLALSTAIIGDIVIRADDNNYQYRLNALPASSLSNWEVLGKDAQPVGETVDDIITTNETITTKPNGLYAFAGIPNGGLPSGVAQGDIAQKTGTTYTIAYTFANAPATIFSKSDNKIYKKTINGNGVSTWETIPEPTIYEVGAGKQYSTLQSAIDNYRADFLANKVVVGNVLIYDSVINESVVIASDVQNLLIEGFGTPIRGNTQIQSITLYGHRITFKNIQVNAFILNSTGTISEYGVTTKRGKHIFYGVIFTNNTTAIDVQGINNFLSFKDCDFNSKPISIANNPSANPVDITTISIDGCANGILNCGTNRLITKNNSLSVYQGTITGTIFDVDGAKPISYSMLRSYSALGLSIPIALKTLVINDDVGGTLQVLKCTTAYTIAGSAGLGTAIDLTKYQVQTDNAKQNITDNTLTTTSKTIVGSINELKTSVDSKAPLNSPSFTGTPTANTAPIGTNTTQIATTQYVKNEINNVIASLDAVVFKGVIDCSTNPNYPAGDAGHLYRISVAGKIGGASGINVEAGDQILCLVDNTASGTQASVGANWNITQVNIDGAVISSETSSLDNDLVLFSGITGKAIKKTTASNFKSLLSLAKNDVGLTNVDNTSDANKPISTAVQTALDAKENSFTKNTAFNKNFGSTTGTVCEGNDARLGTKAIDEANIANDKFLVYNSTTQKLEYQSKPSEETSATIYTKFKNNIIAGSNVSITQDDIAKTLTISASGGGGGGGAGYSIGTVVPFLTEFAPVGTEWVNQGTSYSSSAYPELRNIYAGRQLQPVREGSTNVLLYDGGSLDPLGVPDILFAENPETGVMLYVKWSYYGTNAAIFKPNLANTDLDVVDYSDINTKIGISGFTGSYGMISLAFVKHEGTPYFMLGGRYNGVPRLFRISEANLLSGGMWTEVAAPFTSNHSIVLSSNNNNVLLAVQYYGSQNYIFRSTDAGTSWTGVQLPSSATTYGSCTGYIQKPVWNGNVFFVYFQGREGSATSTDGLNWVHRSTNLYNVFGFNGSGTGTNTYRWYNHCIVGGRNWNYIYLTPQPDSYCTGNYYYGASLYSVDDGVTFRWCNNPGYPGVSWFGEGFLAGQYYSSYSPSAYNYAYSADHNTWTNITIPTAYLTGNYGFIVSRKFQKGYWYSNKMIITVAYNSTFTTPSITNSMGSNVVLKIRAKL
jgi:hypothetical protein